MHVDYVHRVRVRRPSTCWCRDDVARLLPCFWLCYMVWSVQCMCVSVVLFQVFSLLFGKRQTRTPPRHWVVGKSGALLGSPLYYTYFVSSQGRFEREKKQNTTTTNARPPGSTTTTIAIADSFQLSKWSSPSSSSSSMERGSQEREARLNLAHTDTFPATWCLLRSCAAAARGRSSSRWSSSYSSEEEDQLVFNRLNRSVWSSFVLPRSFSSQKAHSPFASWPRSDRPDDSFNS